jgi:hypothetical protein
MLVIGMLRSIRMMDKEGLERLEVLEKGVLEMK